MVRDELHRPEPTKEDGRGPTLTCKIEQFIPIRRGVLPQGRLIKQRGIMTQISVYELSAQRIIACKNNRIP